jgi:hypothetical protein
MSEIIVGQGKKLFLIKYLRSILRGFPGLLGDAAFRRTSRPVEFSEWLSKRLYEPLNSLSDTIASGVFAIKNQRY